MHLNGCKCQQITALKGQSFLEYANLGSFISKSSSFFIIDQYDHYLLPLQKGSKIDIGKKDGIHEKEISQIRLTP